MNKLIQKATLKLLNELCSGWVTEYEFHPTRKWKLDFAHPGKKIGVEVHGAVWTQGRHTRGRGFLNDLEKSNAASMLGWAYLQYTYDGDWVDDKLYEDLRQILLGGLPVSTGGKPLNQASKPQMGRKTGKTT